MLVNTQAVLLVLYFFGPRQIMKENMPYKRGISFDELYDSSNDVDSNNTSKTAKFKANIKKENLLSPEASSEDIEDDYDNNSGKVVETWNS